MILTIGATAKAVNLSKTTICKHIENGKLSASWNRDTNPPQREIDASEIKRVYGVDVTLPHSLRPTANTEKSKEDTPLEIVLKAKDETIATLKAEVDRLSGQIEVKDEQIAAAHRLLAAPRPEPEDRYTVLLDKLQQIEREMATQFAPVPAVPVAVTPTPLQTPVNTVPNQGILGWLRRKVA